MNRTTAFLAVLAVLPFAGLTACGSDDSDGSSASANGSTTAAETTTAAPAASTPAPATTSAPASTTAPAKTPAPATKAEAVAVCHKNFDPYVETLRKLNKEAAAPNHQHYNALVKQLIARYGKLRTLDTYSPSCDAKVQAQLSGARLIHVGAYFSWKECHKSDDCAKTIAELKKNRRQAVKLTNAAVKGFHKVNAS